MTTLLYSAPTLKHKREFPPEWFDRELGDLPEETITFTSGQSVEVEEFFAKQILDRGGKRFSIAPEIVEETESETPEEAPDDPDDDDEGDDDE